jgi:HSP20 family protein
MNLTTVTRWDPFRDLVFLQDRVSPLFTDGVDRFPAEAVGPWMPPVDIYEEADRIVLRAEIPGVNREDIEVKLENGTLTLRGEKKQEKEVNTENAQRIERFYGTFSRSFILPTSVNAERIKATYKDGLLEVIVPKADEAKPKRIEVLAS